MKTNNAGSYRITKYGDPDAMRRKHLVVIITADVRTKRIMGIESHVEGTGPSEPETAQKHVREAVMKGINVREFYGDGAFDTNDLFHLMHQIGAKPVIKIRKNASTDHHRGSKYRRKAVREYREKGYRQWAEENNYGMRWPGTEGIFSAVKRNVNAGQDLCKIAGLKLTPLIYSFHCFFTPSSLLAVSSSSCPSACMTRPLCL